MPRAFLASFVVSTVLLGGGIVGASLTKLQPSPHFAGGSTGHTLLTETSGSRYCAGCHSGASMTAAFTDTAGNTITSTQLYPGETANLQIKGTLAANYSASSTASPLYYLGMNVAANGGTLTSSESYIIKSGTELQHHSTTTNPPALKNVTAGNSNYYQFSYTLTSTVIGSTSTIAGLAAIDQPPGAGAPDAQSIIVTARRPADPTSVSATGATGNSISLSMSSNGPSNRVVVKTGAYATSPTDTSGTAYDFGNTGTVTGLSPLTTYFVKMWAHAPYSPYDTYSTNAVTTTAATTAANVPSGLTVTNASSTGLTLSWVGTSPEYRAIYKAGSLPTSPIDGTLVYEGVNTTATATGLTPNTRYFVAVYGKASGSAQYSTSAVSTSVITSPAALPVVNGGSPAWEARTNPSRLGKFIFRSNTNDLDLYDGTTVSTIQAASGPNTFMTLGTGATPGSVIAAWRTGTDFAWVSVDGGTPVQINATTNPEVVTVDGGNVFAVYRTPNGASENRNAYRVDPATGNVTNISNNNTTVYGVNHISSSGNKAVWLFTDTGSSATGSLMYYSGSATTTVDTGIAAADPMISQGRIVYTKPVASASNTEVFLYDTTLPSPSPVQITSDSTKRNTNPMTDGRHIAWIRSNLDGTSPELVLYGGVQLTSGNFKNLGTGVLPAFELDRGQILWRDTGDLMHHETASGSALVEPNGPAATTNWLADGRVIYFNGSNLYQFNGIPPNDAQQPSAPILVKTSATSSSVTLTWDKVIGASSYTVYYARQSGVTKANYSSLPGGTRVSGLTQNTYTATSLTPNAPYYFIVTTSDATGEGPESRQASAFLMPTPAWTSVGSLGSTVIYSVAADRTIGNVAYAAGGNNTYKSSDGGATWSALAGGIGGVAIKGVAADNNRLFAGTSTGSIYRSVDGGANWTNVLSASGSGESFASLVIDPAVPNTILAADFVLPSYTGGGNDSYVIRTDDGGATWFHTPQMPNFGEIRAYSFVIDPTRTPTMYVGGNATPNAGKTLTGGAGWSDIHTPLSGSVFAVAVDPNSPQTIYAGIESSVSSSNLGVYKSTDAGTTWTHLTGLPTGTPVRAIVVDPLDSNVIHVGSELGYYDSTDGGTTWTAGNTGLTNQFINSLAMTGSHHLIAGTNQGLFMLNLTAAPAPTVTSVSPNTGNVAGGTAVTITGTGFASGATVAFGGVAATNVSVANSATITATTPAHAAGAVNVLVQNPDGQTGLLTNGFTYSTALVAPTGVDAHATGTAQVTVTWNVVGGATVYDVYRRGAGTGFGLINSPATNSYIDNGVIAGDAYLYYVVARNASTSSPNSVSDLATAILFTDDPIVANSTVVKAIHLTEIRNAANAVRLLGGAGSTSFTTGGGAGSIVTAAQINEVRTALDGGLNALGLPTGGYTDTLAAGVTIRAVHFQEIRNRTK